MVAVAKRLIYLGFEAERVSGLARAQGGARGNTVGAGAIILPASSTVLSSSGSSSGNRALRLAAVAPWQIQVRRVFTVVLVSRNAATASFAGL